MIASFQERQCPPYEEILKVVRCSFALAGYHGEDWFDLYANGYLGGAVEQLLRQPEKERQFWAEKCQHPLAGL